MPKNLKIFFLSSLFLLSNQSLVAADDTEAPVLNSISIDQTSINVSSGNQTVSITANFTDDSLLDAIYSYVYFSPPGGSGLNKQFRINSDSSSPAVLTAEFTNTDDANGTYELGGFVMYDTIGNAKSYTKEELIALGLPASIELTANETTPPTVNAVNPEDGSTEISRGQHISISFSEDMIADTLISDNIYVSDSSGNRVTTKNGGSSAKNYTITPAQQTILDLWESNETYTVHVTTGVKDTSGNNLAQEFTSTFTTLDSSSDTTPPTIASITPVDGATDISTGAEIAISFSEIMYEPSLYQSDPENIYITDSSGNKVEHRKQTGPEKQELVPDPLWENNETYTVHVTTGVEDTNGNNLAQEFTSSFTTESGDNVCSPVITSAATFSAAENQTAVGTVTVSDANCGPLTYSLSGTDAASFSISTASDGTNFGIITFNTAPDYETKSSYSITVSVSDGANSTTQAITINVTDVDEGTDTTPPTVTSVTPADGATGVSRAITPIQVNFSEEMNRETYTNNIYLADSSGNVVTLQSVGPGTTFYQLSPQSTLEADATYTVHVTTAVEDINGNNLAQEFTSSFTTDTLGFNFGANNKPIAGVKVTQTESDGTTTIYASDAEGKVTLNTTTNTYSLEASLAETGTDPISVQDALYILQYIVELRTLDDLQIKAAEINGDGKITIQDALKVLQHNVELISLEPSLTFYDANTGNPLSETTYNPEDTPSVTAIRLGDANLSFEPASITDHAPILTGKITLTMDENEVDIGTIVAIDADGDTLTYSISGGADKDLFNINPSSGALSFKAGPDYEDPGDNGFNNLYDVEIMVSDGSNSNTQALIISVIDLNEKLGVSNKTISENEAGATVGILSIIDSSFSSDGITYELSGDDAQYFILDGNTIKLKSNVTTDFETKSRYTLVVTATNSAGETVTEKVVVKIENVNEAPILSSAILNQSIDEDSPLNFAIPNGTFFDVDGNTLSYTASLSDGESLPGWMSFDGVSGTFSGTPRNDDVGVIGIKITASDGSFNANDSFNLTVNNTNDQPSEISLSANAFNENSDGVTIGDLTTNDDDNKYGDTHTYELSGTDASSFEIKNDQLKLKDSFAANFEVKDNYTLDIKSTDESGSSISKSIALNVIDTNDTPTEIILSSTGVPEKIDGAVVGTLTTNDEDADDSHTYIVSDDRFEVIDGELKLKPGNTVEYATQSTITVIITTTDSNGATFNQEFILRVGSIQLTATNFEENVSGAIVGDLSITDPDFSANVTYTLSGTDADSFEVVNDQLKLKDTISADYESKNTYTISITAKDDANKEATLSYSLQVIDVNEAPTLITLSASAIDENSDGAVIGNLETNDEDADDNHTYELTGNDAASFEVSDGQLKLKSDLSADYETKNSYSVTVTTTDTGGLSTSEDFIITVNDINDAPESISLSANAINENDTGAIVGTLSTNDDDADDTHTYSFSGDDSSSFEVINGNQLKLKSTVSANYEAKNNYSFNVISNDSGRLSFSETFIISVNDVNDPPTISSVNSLTIPENQISAGTVTATDEDGDSLTYTLSGTDQSSLSIGNSGTITFNTAPDYETKTSYSVTVTVSDGASPISQDLSINITNLNDVFPVISSSSTLNADENQTSVGTVEASDVEGDVLIYQLSGDDAGALNISSSGIITFDAAPNYESKNTYSALLSVNDGVNTTSQNLTININDVNDIPLINSNSTFNANENQTYAGLVDAQDEDGDDLSYSVRGSDAALFNIDDSGEINFITAPDYEVKDLYSISVAVSDGELTNTQNLTINVTDLYEEYDIDVTALASRYFVLDSDVPNTTDQNCVSNTFGSEQSIVNPSTVIGHAGGSSTCSDASDFYSIQLTEGMYANLQVSDYDSSNDLDMYLYNQDGTGIDFSYTDDSTENNETINLPSSGTIIIRIYPYSGSSKYVLTVGQRTSDSSANRYSNQVGHFIEGEFISYIPFPKNGPRKSQSGRFQPEEQAEAPLKQRIKSINSPGLRKYKFDPDLEMQRNKVEGSGLPSDVNLKLSDAQISYLKHWKILSQLREENPDRDIGFNFKVKAFNNQPDPKIQASSADEDRYQWVKERKTFAEAKAHAESLGGHLATITSASENQAIYEIVSEGFDPNSSYLTLGTATDGGGSVYVWLGADDIETEGDWNWHTGESFSTYTNWGSVEPDNFNGNQDALGMALEGWPYGSGGAYGKGSEWNDIKADNQLTFVVEFESGSNNPPVITSGSTFTAAENQTSVGTVTATDEDGDNLTFTLSGTDASSLSINSSGVITFNTAPDYETKTSYSVTVTVSDGTDSVSQAITISITDVDDGESDPITPFSSDSLYKYQWNMNAIGLEAALNAVGQDTRDIVVAVLDTGSPSTTSTAWARSDFIAGGADFYDLDFDPTDPDALSDDEKVSSHGTHVATTIAAKNDGLDINGFGIKVLPIRVLGPDGGSTYDIIQGMLYSAGLPNDTGTVAPTSEGQVKVINMSLGIEAYKVGYCAYTNAINDVISQGVTIVAASGNEAQENPGGASYPAACDNIISVGSIDTTGLRAPYSTYNNSVDIAAPGGNMGIDENGDGYPDGVLAYVRDETVNFLQGTSMASPTVAGALALLHDVDKGLNPAEIDAYIRDGKFTDDIGPSGRDDEYGYGSLNLSKAVQSILETETGGNSDNITTTYATTSPLSLNYGFDTNSLDIKIEKIGNGSLSVESLSADNATGLSYTSNVDDDGFGTYSINIDRTSMPAGNFQNTIYFNMSDGTKPSTKISYSVGSERERANLGGVQVVVFDVGSDGVVDVNDAIYTGGILDLDGTLSFRVNNVETGNYYIYVSTDIDRNNIICEAGEICEAYPIFADTDQYFSVTGKDIDGGEINVKAQVYYSSFSASALSNGQKQFEKPGPRKIDLNNKNFTASIIDTSNDEPLPPLIGDDDKFVKSEFLLSSEFKEYSSSNILYPLDRVTLLIEDTGQRVIASSPQEAKAIKSYINRVFNLEVEERTSKVLD